MTHDIILASASPRRRELLASAGIHATVWPSHVAEDQRAGETPSACVQRLAQEKAAHIAGAARQRNDLRIVLGADTVVVLGDAILGKPKDHAEAQHMLMRLSGATHTVLTGFCLIPHHRPPHTAVVATDVTFKTLSSTEIMAYLDLNAWQDKAGGYAVQDSAAKMVRRIDGSYTNVVGLPLCEVIEALASLS